MNQQTIDRNRAIVWARTVLERPAEYFILDTETTGLDNPEVIELAVINLTGEMIVNQRFNPVTKISPEATDTHGMTNEVLAIRPRWAIVSNCLPMIVFPREILSYNYRLDYQAICNTYSLHCMDAPNLRGECVMLWYSQYIGEWDDRRRSYRWQKLTGGDHSALGDCNATLDLIKQMARSPMSGESESILTADRLADAFVNNDVILLS
jgi:DNA polymerase III subunit epsilon